MKFAVIADDIPWVGGSCVDLFEKRGLRWGMERWQQR